MKKKSLFDLTNYNLCAILVLNKDKPCYKQRITMFNSFKVTIPNYATADGFDFEVRCICGKVEMGEWMPSGDDDTTPIWFSCSECGEEVSLPLP